MKQLAEARGMALNPSAGQVASVRRRRAARSPDTPQAVGLRCTDSTKEEVGNHQNNGRNTEHPTDQILAHGALQVL